MARNGLDMVKQRETAAAARDATAIGGRAGDEHLDAFPAEAAAPDTATYGEGDHEESSEMREGDR